MFRNICAEKILLRQEHRDEEVEEEIDAKKAKYEYESKKKG
jgi:hypothetical protein